MVITVCVLVVVVASLLLSIMSVRLYVTWYDINNNITFN